MMLAILLLGLVSAGPLPPRSMAAGSSSRHEEQLFREAQDAFQRRDLQRASKKLNRAINGPTFASLESSRRHEILVLAGAVAAEMKRWSEAHSHYVRATELPEATAEDWDGRANAAYKWGYKPEYVRSLTRVARLDPSLLRGVPDHRVFWALDAPPWSSRELDLLEALFDAGWTTAGGGQPDSSWREFAAMLLSQKEGARAVAVAARIANPYVLVSMRVDRRFAALVAADTAHYDIAAAVAHEVERSQAVMASRPQSLAALSVHLDALMAAMEYQQVYDLAGEAISRANALGPAQYEDVDDHLAWIYDQRSRSAQALGRWAEAVAQMNRGREIPERGRPNVSQSINLGWLLCALDRPVEALLSISAVTAVSRFGRMQVEIVRYVAALEIGDQASAAAAMSWMRAQERDDRGTLQDALIIAGDMDEAASVFKSRLVIPWLRSEALLEIQNFAETPETPRMRAIRDRRRSFLAREDVRKTLEAVGRIERFTVPHNRLIYW